MLADDLHEISILNCLYKEATNLKTSSAANFYMLTFGKEIKCLSILSFTVPQLQVARRPSP